MSSHLRPITYSIHAPLNCTMASFSTHLLLLHSFLLASSKVQSAFADHAFVFNGFKQAASNLTLDEYAVITPAGALQLTNVTSGIVGRAFFSSPITFFNTTSNRSQLHSFATHFVISLVPIVAGLGGGHGMTFVLSPTKSLPKQSSGPFLGLIQGADNGKPSNRIIAVEFDTARTGFGDIDDNHVGIDVNSVKSSTSETAAYYTDDTNKKKIMLEGGEAIQTWVEYNGATRRMQVTISPLNVPKPKKPLLSYELDISTIVKESVYVGFTAATGKAAGTHSVLGWSFAMGDSPPPSLDVQRLPSPPRPCRCPCLRLINH